MGASVARLHTVWVDGGNDCDPFMQWVMNFCRWTRASSAATLHSARGLSCCPNALVVERTFGWLVWCRRLNKDYELLPETAETFIYLAMIRMMVRRLA